MNAAVRVGMFVSVGALLLLGTYAGLRASLFAPRTDGYEVVFEDAGGLTAGSPVLMSGVKVGQVDSVALRGPGVAVAKISVEHGTQVPVGSTAEVPASLIGIGDFKLEIRPGAGQAGILSTGSTIPGVVGSPFEKLLPDSKATLKELNRTLAAMRKLLEDGELKGGLKDLLASLDETSKKFGGLANRADGMIAKNQGQLESLLRTASASMSNIKIVSDEVRRLVASGELQDKASLMIDNLNKAVVQGNGLITDLRAMANDPELNANLRGAAENFKVMSDSGVRIASDAEVMAKNGVEVSAEAKLLLQKANAMAEKVDKLIDRFNGTVDQLSERSKGLAKGIELEATLAAESKPGRTRTEINTTLPVGKDKVTVGLWDAFESNKINAQFQRSLTGTMDLRYGAYASKPGVGVDWQATKRLGLKSDLFGLNEPRFDLRMKYKVDNNSSVWVGLERIFERNAPSIGVTVRK